MGISLRVEVDVCDPGSRKQATALHRLSSPLQSHYCIYPSHAELLVGHGRSTRSLPRDGGWEQELSITSALMLERSCAEVGIPLVQVPFFCLKFYIPCNPRAFRTFWRRQNVVLVSQALFQFGKERPRKTWDTICVRQAGKEGLWTPPRLEAPMRNSMTIIL